jgi:NAD(P)-dependent dehydrogenase (short-subunit alcohol dehydrogenase family)
MSNHFDLSAKTLVVSGGAGLIGEAITRALASHGARVVVADLDDVTGRHLANESERVEFVHCDVTIEREVRDVVANVYSTYGTFDGLVNTSFPRPESWSKRFEEVNVEDWRDHVNANLTTYFLNAKVAADVLVDQGGGCILNLGSIYGLQAPDFDIYDGTDMTSPVAYAAIKAGVVNLTRYMASYLGGHGIRVNALSPGGVWDKQHPTFVENYQNRVPLGRMAAPEDMQGAAVFLLSDAASYITGHNLVVDGGWTIC